MHACGGFFGHALDRGAGFCEPTGRFGHAFFDLCKDGLFLFGFWNGDKIGFPFFHPCTQKHIERRIAAIIKNHVCALWEHERTVEVIPMLFQGLTFDRKNWRAACGDCRGGVVLGGENVARGPAHIRTKLYKCLNQDCRLDGHMQ